LNEKDISLKKKSDEIYTLELKIENLAKRNEELEINEKVKYLSC
jgi:hypothetical protein